MNNCLKVKEKSAGNKKCKGMVDLHREFVGKGVPRAYIPILSYMYATMFRVCRLLVGESVQPSSYNALNLDCFPNVCRDHSVVIRD